MVTEELKNMSPTEPARHQSGFKERRPEDILCEKEWQRRFMIEQHELDKKLILEQVKWMKLSIVCGFIGILTGALITAFATNFATTASQKNQEITQKESSQLQALQRIE